MNCLCLQQLFMCLKTFIVPPLLYLILLFNVTCFSSSWNASFSRPSFSSLPRYVIAHFWNWISNVIKTLRILKAKTLYTILNNVPFVLKLFFQNFSRKKKSQKILFYFDTSIVFLFDFVFKRISWKIITHACTHHFCPSKWRSFTQTQRLKWKLFW